MQRTVVVQPPPRRGVHRFSHWVGESVHLGDRVLNIGAGWNRSGSLRDLAARGPYLVGIDPDSSIHRNPTLDEAHQLTLEEYAARDPERFDVAFCVYVLEHVADPESFVESVFRVLKPGGTFFGLTLNRYQYFGFITWATTWAGVSEQLLRRIKPADRIDAYHFPTPYRLNSIGCVTRHLSEAGFTSVEFRCFEETRRYASYLPRPLRPLAGVWTKAAYASGRASLMGHLSFKAMAGGVRDRMSLPDEG